MMCKFQFPELKHSFPLIKTEIDILTLTKPPIPSDFVNNNIALPKDSSYSQHGKVKLDSWQVFPINLIQNKKLKELILVASTQFAKSFISEMILLYNIVHQGGNYLFVYNDLTTAKDVFQDRLQPVLKHNLCTKKLITENIDDIRVDKIRLKNSVIRIGSPIRRCFASHSYNMVYLSECAKYQTDFDYVQLAKSRFTQVLGQTLLLLESSPTDQSTSFAYEVERIKTHLFPFVQCNSCKKYFYMEDKLIKEIPNDDDGVFDHNVNRILDNEAAFLECPHCQTQYKNQQKTSLLKTTIWASSAEEIQYNSNTQLDYADESEIVLHANRLYSIKYSFSDCLAAYFSALQSADVNSLDSYQQEVMGRFTNKSYHSNISDKYLIGQCLSYNQYSDDVQYPNDIDFAVVGMDTQDDNIRFTLLGVNVSDQKIYVLSEDKIDFEKTIITAYDLAQKMKERIYNIDYIKQNGDKIYILGGLIDRGGHLSSLIDGTIKYISGLYSCFGAAAKHKPLIERSNVSNCYALNSEQNSRNVDKFLSDGKIFLPNDISSDFLTEIKEEYWITKINKNGQKYEEFYKGSNNHARSCFNYAFAFLHLYECFAKPERVLDHVKSKTIKIDADSDSLQQTSKSKQNHNFLKNRFR